MCEEKTTNTDNGWTKKKIHNKNRKRKRKKGTDTKIMV